ncbi:MAG: hypothetical protein AABY93_15615, partial [Bacteroidota bacterium]
NTHLITKYLKLSLTAMTGQAGFAPLHKSSADARKDDTFVCVSPVIKYSIVIVNILKIIL